MEFHHPGGIARLPAEAGRGQRGKRADRTRRSSTLEREDDDVRLEVGAAVDRGDRRGVRSYVERHPHAVGRHARERLQRRRS